MDIERIVWVAYYTKQNNFGTKSGFTDKFENARIYNKRGHLTSSIGRNKIKIGDVIAVPIKMVLEETTLVTLKLGGGIEDII